MSRRLVAIGLGLVLAGCTGGATTSEQADRQPVSTISAAPTQTTVTTPKPTLKPTATPTLAQLPKGLVSYPVGTGKSPLPYLEYLPQGYGDGTPRPLLVFLHGVDEMANGTEASLRKILGLGIPQLIAAGAWPAERPFVVLMPQEPAARSDRCDFGPEIDQFLDFAVDRYEIDETRIYLTGISCGAIGVLDYLARSQERRVAATVPISSAPYEGPEAGASVRGGCAIARTPTWFFHGALDDTVPVHYAVDAVTDLHACKNPPPKEIKLTIYSDADHDAWTRTYDGSAGHDIYGWLLKHKSN